MSIIKREGPKDPAKKELIIPPDCIMISETDVCDVRNDLENCIDALTAAADMLCDIGSKERCQGLAILHLSIRNLQLINDKFGEWEDIIFHRQYGDLSVKEDK